MRKFGVGASTSRVDSEPSVLDRSDLSKRLDRGDYEKQLSGLQQRLRDLEFECYGRRVASVVVYEGWDAAGKGGNIKRLTPGTGPARLRGGSDKRAYRRGKEPPLPVAFLATIAQRAAT